MSLNLATPPKSIFVTGIHTEIGKTVSSCVLVRALNAHYWKPVQTGTDTDTRSVRDLTQAPCYPEAYTFDLPVSPHLAAEKAGKQIVISEIKARAPWHAHQIEPCLIIEGAGGVLTPLNYGEFIIDMASALLTPVILVSTHYLGSLNHTYLSMEAIRRRGIRVLGVILVGHANPDLDVHLEKLLDAPILARIPKADVINQAFIEQEAKKLREQIFSTETHPLWTYCKEIAPTSGTPYHPSIERPLFCP